MALTFRVEADGTEVCGDYLDSAEAEAFASGYITALLRTGHPFEVDIQVVTYEFTEPDGYTEIRRDAV